MRGLRIPDDIHFDVMKAPMFGASGVLAFLPQMPSKVFVMGKNKEFIAFLDKVSEVDDTEHWHFIFYQTVVFGCTVVGRRTYEQKPDIFEPLPPVPALTLIRPRSAPRL